MPFRVMGLSASNSAANEWCAAAGAVAISRPSAARPPRMYAFICSSSVGLFTTSGLSGTIVLAEMPRHFLSRHPAERRAARPGPRVRTGVLDRHIVLQGIEIGARESLDQAK